MSKLIPITTLPLRKFKGHEEEVMAVAVFPDKRRMITGSQDNTLRVWDLKTGVVLKKMEGHRKEVLRLTVSPDGQLIASGDKDGEVIVWHGGTGESLTRLIKAHSNWIMSLDFSPDGTVLATGSWDEKTKLWNTKTWEPQGKLIECGGYVYCIRFSPSGELFAIATLHNVQIYNTSTRGRVAYFKAHTKYNYSLAWTPDGTRLLTGGDNVDPTIREWDVLTWQQVSDPWTGNSSHIIDIAVNPAGTLIASASYDKHVHLWRFSDRQTVAIFYHISSTECITFSVDSKHILSAGADKMISEWAVPEGTNSKVTELNPSSHVGFELTHTALRGAQSKLEDAIRKAAWIELENAPFRLLNTSTGLLCNRAAQINSFKMSLEYKELLSFTTTHSDLQMERIKEVVAKYFRCVLLSHRWEETEALLHDIQDKIVYELNGIGGIVKLQSFCKIARDAGYGWAWMDTCCIDKSSNTELQESINSMFVWYRYSALTIVYLCDVPPSSQPGALARSVWNERGWTFQEFVAPKVVIFYQKDWSLYLDDRSPNHKESPAIMKELEDAMCIDQQAFVSFRPGMRYARERLQWASARTTTLQEDIAYSLFGIFGVHLPVIYGEKKQNALGRLLQEIVARSGDITALDWVGQSSEFNSCLPADIISYAAPPCALPSLSEDEVQTAVSSLRSLVAVECASKLYTLLENMNAPRFANCRLHLPCIAFRVTEVKRRRGHSTHFTYGVKADGLQDLLVTTDETLIQFSRARPTQQIFFLVRPWDRRLLELPDFADEVESVGDWSEPESLLDDSDELPDGSFGEEELPVDSESHSRSLRLIVRLGQPFGALLLAQQRIGEYKRIASDHDIIAQVKDAVLIDNMDIRILDIL